MSRAPTLAALPRLHPYNKGFEWRPRSAAPFRRLTESEHRQYNELGFVKLEGLFSPEAIAAVTAARATQWSSRA